MPTILTHAVIPLAIGIAAGNRRIPKRLIAVGAACAMLPDLDVVAFRLGIAYADAFGHRGASHSLVFALLAGLFVWLFAKRLGATRTTAFLFAAVSTLSHALLDALTDGGLGVALWWPASHERIFLPWRVIEVSPIGLSRFLSARGLEVLRSELVWVWLPALSTAGLLALLRKAGVRSDIRTRSRQSGR